MDRRTLLAIVLSIVVMLAWLQFFTPTPPEQPQQRPGTTEETVTGSEPQQEQQEVETVETAQIVETDTEEYDEASLTEQTFTVQTDVYTVSVSNHGARITSLLYGDRNIELVAPTKYSDGMIDCSFYMSDRSFLNGNALDDTLWHVSEQSDMKIVFAKSILVNGKRVIVNKTYEFVQDSYHFNLTYSFTNGAGEAVALPEGKLIFSANDFIGPRMNDYDNRYNIITQLYYTDKKKKFSKGGGFMKEAKDITHIREQGEWTGIISRYFAALIMTDGKPADGIVADTRKDTAYRTGLIYELPVLAEDVKQTYQFKVAIAEKKKNLLSSIDPNLEGASDTNKFIDPIRVAVLWSLTKLNVIIPNYGWCVIVFSIITKLLFLPLTQRSTESMKKMSKLQPEIQKLKEKYKDDQQKLQEATMKLYKERGVNPMGGCLPLIVQMPFFIALYSALINSVELWNTPFILWINDLSIPDTAFSVAGYDIHILPLIMTVTSFFQQKVSTVDTGAGGQQQMMMKVMPVVLLFIFWSMPSGLILYWTVQNILQVGHQLFVNRGKDD
ncbi:MAG: membrane protein insertase YidC [Spirochaetota bacterium]